MAKVNFILRGVKKDKNKFGKTQLSKEEDKSRIVSIYVSLTSGRDIKLETITGFNTNLKDWKFEEQRAKQNDAANKELNNNLNRLQAYLYEELNSDLAKEKINIDKYWLKEKIINCFNRSKKEDTSLVLSYFQNIIEKAEIEKILSGSRIKNYKNAKSKLEDFQKKIGKELHFIDIDKTFVDNYIKWLNKDKNYSLNHIGQQLSILKFICREANKEDKLQVTTYSLNIPISKVKRKDKHIITFTPDEIEKIKNAELKREALINARKWLLIGCEIGQRGGDLLKITFDNIRYSKGKMLIDLTQSKTDKDVTIPVAEPHIIDIIENEFPYPISLQKLNLYLKDVCKEAEINQLVKGSKFDKETKRKKVGMYPKFELVTNHSLRRTFATKYYKKMLTSILMQITGHSKESTFLEYINEKEDKDENAKLFLKLWENIQREEEPQLKVSKRA